MPPDPPEIEESRHLGRLEGEAFDRALAAVEREERDERLRQLGGERALAEERRDRAEVARRQRREIERLSEWQHTVLSSRGWRLVQSLRRPFGRAW